MSAGDDGGLRIGPWVPGPVSQPGHGQETGPFRPVIREAGPVADPAPPRVDPLGGTEHPTGHGDGPAAHRPEIALERAEAEPAARADPRNDAGEPSGQVADPSAHEDEPDRYLGRRRGARPPRRRVLLVGAVVAVLGAAVVIPLALRPDPPSNPSAGTATPDGNAAGPAVVTSALDSHSSGPDPSPSPSPSPSGSPSPSPSQSASQSTLRSVSYEAEGPQNLLGGSASVAAWPGASGGRIVLNLGEWGPGAKKQGTLAFTGVTVPADGKYTLRLYTVDTDGEATRTAVINAAGAPITVTVVSGPNCCAVKAVEVSLRKGANTITFDGANGRAPSLDRIVISIP